MNMTEDFRREALELLVYSRLWLRNVKALSRWVSTWDKEKPESAGPSEGLPIHPSQS